MPERGSGTPDRGSGTPVESKAAAVLSTLLKIPSTMTCLLSFSKKVGTKSWIIGRRI
jgi:hypothetical protein